MAAIDRTESATKLRFRTEAEDSSAEIKLKIEINTRERQAFDRPQTIPYAVQKGKAPTCYIFRSPKTLR
jgi:hypothetical protein